MQTLPLAHFTPAEIPGTLAVLCLGLCIGVLVARGRAATRLMAVVAVSLAVFAVLGYSGDVEGWPEPVRVAIDLAFLAHAGLLATLSFRWAAISRS
jgi:hypothetical protein